MPHLARYKMYWWSTHTKLREGLTGWMACRAQSLSATSMHVWRVLHKVNIFIHFCHYLSSLSHYDILLKSLRSNFGKLSHIFSCTLIGECCNIGRVPLNYHSRQSGGESTSGELHVASRVHHFVEMSYEHLLEKHSKL